MLAMLDRLQQRLSDRIRIHPGGEGMWKAIGCHMYLQGLLEDVSGQTTTTRFAARELSALVAMLVCRVGVIESRAPLFGGPF